MEKETHLNDSTKLAIREEVERRLDSPTASFTERIEAEVEKRVEQRVKNYRMLGGVVVVLIGAFVVILWNVSLSTVRKTVADQLSENEVIKAKDRILTIQSIAEGVNQNLNDISASMATNQQIFMQRLNQIKQQDNVVLVDDFSKMFVVKTVSNLVDGKKIVLDYEPIPQTVNEVYVQNSGSASLMSYVVEGNTIVFTNNLLMNNNRYRNLTNSIAHGQLRIGYTRKSPH